MIRASNIISYLFHPVFMPLIGVFLILHSGIYAVNAPNDFTRFIYLIVILTNSILPLSFLPALIYFKNIRTFEMNERRERFIPLFFTTICFYLTYHIIARVSPIMIINMFLLSTVVTVFLLTVISIFWKISLHMAGIGGLAGMVVVLSVSYSIDTSMLLCVIILLGGIIGSARMAATNHTPIQVLLGFVTGLAGAMVLFLHAG